MGCSTNKTRTKTIVKTVRVLLFADDDIPVVQSFEDIQLIVNNFPPASIAFGLTISIKNATCPSVYL